MAKVIKYGDTSGIEGNLEQAPVGLYFAKVSEINAKKSKNDEDMVEIIWQITKDASGKKTKKQYARIWAYAPLDPKSSWARRLKELVEAFGLKEKGGNIGTIEGKEAMVRLREDTDNDGEYRPQISKVLKPKAVDEEPDEDEDEDEDEEEGGDATSSLAGLSRAELKALIKEEELEVKVVKSMSDSDIAAAIIEAGWEPEGDEEEEDEDEEEDDEEEEDEEEAEEDNYDDMSIKELRQEAKDRELDTKGSKAVLIARLRTDDEEEPV
jgi:hypothetical protein